MWTRTIKFGTTVPREEKVFRGWTRAVFKGRGGGYEIKPQKCSPHQFSALFRHVSAVVTILSRSVVFALHLKHCDTQKLLKRRLQTGLRPRPGWVSSLDPLVGWGEGHPSPNSTPSTLSASRCRHFRHLVLVNPTTFLSAHGPGLDRAHASVITMLVLASGLAAFCSLRDTWLARAAADTVV